MADRRETGERRWAEERNDNSGPEKMRRMVKAVARRREKEKTGLFVSLSAVKGERKASTR